MAFFNDLTRGIKVTGQTVAQKTKEIGETVQIKSQINTEKETITRLYAAIGKQIFESGNEEAEKKFKEASEAYAVLSDPEKEVYRCMYCEEKYSRKKR